MGYRLLEGVTLADVAFRAEEADLEELFRTAWRATLELMLPDPSALRAREKRRIALANPAVDLLLFDFLGELNLKTSSAKLTVQRALNRSKERLETLEATFAPIQDKAVPERITLRQKIEDYKGAVRDFEYTLARW